MVCLKAYHNNKSAQAYLSIRPWPIVLSAVTLPVFILLSHIQYKENP